MVRIVKVGRLQLARHVVIMIPDQKPRKIFDEKIYATKKVVKFYTNTQLHPINP